MLEADVLVVGAGPVGLTASIALSQHGVRHVVVERHPSTSVAPKARGINARTMEMYRQMGVEDDIRAAGMPSRFGGMMLCAESLFVREKFGIGRTDEKDIYDSVNGHFRADLRPWVEDRPGPIFARPALKQAD
jgi:2-polyprenyl-6-methoxyphenol hydroxylase-like FAD-dependent oxidoreductase